MSLQVNQDYYIKRKPELLRQFDEESAYWQPVVVSRYGKEPAETIMQEARREFEGFIPKIPYIGGDENRLTNFLVEAVRYLAFYKAMKKNGKTAEETGKILYDVTLTRIGEPRPTIPPGEWLTPEQLNERRKQNAARSQERRYPGDYVFEFVMGDGKEFDYGYDFIECAAQKFYHNEDADEFMPFYCYLDFPISRIQGIGFSRTMTLAEGYKKCNHRIKKGKETRLAWPPPFLKK